MMLVTTDMCEFIAKTCTLQLASELIAGGFPKSISVKSIHTGRVIDFMVDVQAGIDNEFWDGEQCEYYPTEVENSNVKRLVIYNAY